MKIKILAVLFLLVGGIACNRERSTSELSANSNANVPTVSPTPEGSTAINGNGLAPPARRIFHHSLTIKTHYDRFKDQTLIDTDYDPYPHTFPSMHIRAFFGFNGRTLTTTPDTLFFEIMSASDEAKFAGEPPQLTALVDGQRMSLGNMYRSNFEVSEAGAVYEYLVTTLKTQDFFKLVNSRSVEMQVGIDEFKLTENQLEALRDLASRMAP
jgi:hypothetical protein